MVKVNSKNLQRLESNTKGNSPTSTTTRFDANKIGGALSEIFKALDHLRPERQQMLLESVRAMVLKGDFSGVTDSYIYNVLDATRQEAFELWASLFDPASQEGGDDMVMKDTALDAIDERLSMIQAPISNVSENAALPYAYGLKHEQNPDYYPSLDDLQIAYMTNTSRDGRSIHSLANVYSSRFRLEFGDAVHLAWVVSNAEPSLAVVNVLNARRFFVK